MKLHLLIPSLVAVLAFVSPQLCAQVAPPTPVTPPASTAKKKPDTPLEKQMHRINKSMRALKKQINDPAQNASSLRLVAIIQDAAGAAAKLSPAKAEDYTGAEKDKFIANYQAGMKDFRDAVDKLADALKANDNAAAARDFKRLFSIEKEDHKQFRRPDKD